MHFALETATFEHATQQPRHIVSATCGAIETAIIEKATQEYDVGWVFVGHLFTAFVADLRVVTYSQVATNIRFRLPRRGTTSNGA